ncbi:hypothetical protein D3C81_1302450 [compost metagenome]
MNWASAASSPSPHSPPGAKVGRSPSTPGSCPNTVKATVCTEAAPSFLRWSAKASMHFMPGASLSGQSNTSRPTSAAKSAFCQEFVPLGQQVATCSGNRSAAASAAFSPSHSTTGAKWRLARSSRRSSGRGSDKPCQRQASESFAEFLHQVRGANTLRGVPLSSGPRSKRYSTISG